MKFELEAVGWHGKAVVFLFFGMRSNVSVKGATIGDADDPLNYQAFLMFMLLEGIDGAKYHMLVLVIFGYRDLRC